MEKEERLDMRLRLCAFADEAAVELATNSNLAGNNINLIELRNVGGKTLRTFRKEGTIFRMLKENGIEVGNRPDWKN